ncbi:hypothetical protein N5V81_14050 [Escherichia coli]|nr:hypothetical protein [Escherichia coli]
MGCVASVSAGAHSIDHGVSSGQVATDDLHLDFMSEAAVLARKAGVDLAEARYILSQHVYADAFNMTVKNLLSY